MHLNLFTLYLHYFKRCAYNWESFKTKQEWPEENIMLEGT